MKTINQHRASIYGLELSPQQADSWSNKIEKEEKKLLKLNNSLSKYLNNSNADPVKLEDMITKSFDMWNDYCSFFSVEDNELTSLFGIGKEYLN